MQIKDLQEAYFHFSENQKNELKSSELFRPIQYILNLKSKKIRPLLALIGYSLFDDAIDNCMHAAHGLEVFHNFTLMHDDIMDEADLRRGMPSTHKEFGINAAILSGDAMSILAYQYLLHDCKESNALPALALFNKTAMDICIGQQLDMEFEGRNHLTSEEYIEMITLKTAVFLGMALQLGAIIGGASASQSRALYDYGTHLGIAFQIQDDLLDLIGDQNQVGKTKGGDILRKKKTILITKALEITPSDTKKQIMDLLNSDTINTDNKVNQMIELLDSLQLFDVVRKEIKEHFDLANAHLQQLNISEKGKDLLNELTSLLHGRNK